jgi:hypothetical protein
MKRFFVISILAAGLAGVMGWASVDRSGDTQAVIRETESKISRAFEPKQLPAPEHLKNKFTKVVQLTPAWSEIEEIAEPLTWHNQRIAEAKAMVRYDFYIEKMDKYIWIDRESLANEPWLIEESKQFAVRKVTSTLFYAAAGFATSFLLLIIIVWSWKFLLARIRELSDAFRGK